MSWMWTIFTSSVLGGFLYWYFKRPKNYLQNSGIPYAHSNPLCIPFFIIKAAIKGVNVHEDEEQRYKKYGRIYGMSDMMTPCISIAELDILRKIFVKDFHVFTGRRKLISGDPIADSMVSMVHGEKWKRIRTIITPVFSTSKIKRMTEIIKNSAKALVETFKDHSGQPIDGKRIFSTFTMDVIASTAFGTKIHSYKDPNNIFIQKADKIQLQSFSWKLILLFLFPNITQFIRVNVWPSESIEFFRDEIMKIINHRKKTGQTKNDFLQLLMDAEKESHEEREREIKQENSIEYTDDKNSEELGHGKENSKIFQFSKKYKSLSHDELIAQCVIFFLAGYDTTSTTLACLFHMLAVNPEIQNKLRNEVDDVIQKHDGKLTYEAVQDMKYLDCVLSETLRMFPPLVRLERVAEEDYKIEDKDLVVKKGTIVTIPIYAIQRDSEFYPEPETFKPERFEMEQKKERHPYSYLSFGAGPRNCIGMRFALMEIKFCVAYVISYLKIKQCAETKVPLEMTCPLALLRPNAKFTVEERNDISLNEL